MKGYLIMKKTAIYGIIGTSAVLLLAACGGGGGGSTPAYSKAETKAYLFCAMSSNSRIVSIESALTIPAGFDVPYLTPAVGDSLYIYNLNTTSVSAPLFTNSNGSISGTYNTSNHSLKYTMLLGAPTFTNISSSKTGNGREIASLTFPFTTLGTVPTGTLPVEDILPTVGKERNGQRDYLTGCKVNYVTTFK